MKRRHVVGNGPVVPHPRYVVLDMLHELEVFIIRAVPEGRDLRRALVAVGGGSKLTSSVLCRVLGSRWLEQDVPSG